MDEDVLLPAACLLVVLAELQQSGTLSPVPPHPFCRLP